MKKINMFLVALFAGVSPLGFTALYATPPSGQEVSLERSGQASVAELRKAYEAGEYSIFLKQMDASYQNGQSERKQLVAMRVGLDPEWKTWEDRVQILQEERDQQLLAAIQGQPETPLTEKVRFAATPLVDAAQQKGISYFTHLRQMAPGSGKGADENALIALDLEYEFKASALDLPGSSALEKRAMLCALKMERLDRMLQAATSFKDENLKKEIALYAKNFDVRLAQSWDIADLNLLSHGPMTPASALEEHVASVIQLYQEKFSQMTQEVMAKS